MKKRYLGFLIYALSFSLLAGGCGSKHHWGQDLNPEKAWWKKEGNSWDRKEKIFMSIGTSNPNWTDLHQQRKSADLNASAEAGKFMQQLIKTYMKEASRQNFAVAEDSVESSSHEALIGAVIVARHKDKKKGSLSLLKVDLGYFFGRVDERVKALEKSRLTGLGQARGAQLDEQIQVHLEKIGQKLRQIEEATLKKEMPTAPD